MYQYRDRFPERQAESPEQSRIVIHGWPGGSLFARGAGRCRPPEAIDATNTRAGSTSKERRTGARPSESICSSGPRGCIASRSISFLTDLLIPGGIDGIELSDQLVRENPRLKVVYVCGFRMEPSGESPVLDEGVNFLTKPLVAQKPALIIRANLDGRAGPPEAICRG